MDKEKTKEKLKGLIIALYDLKYSLDDLEDKDPIASIKGGISGLIDEIREEIDNL